MATKVQLQEDLVELRERFGQLIWERDRDREALRLIVERPMSEAHIIAQERLDVATAEKVK
jgi:hypothetical protein